MEFANRSGHVDCQYNFKTDKFEITIDGVLYKPFDKPFLVESVKSMVNGYAEFENVHVKPATLTTEPDDIPDFSADPFGLLAKETKRKMVKIGGIEFMKKWGLPPTRLNKVMRGMVHNRLVAPYAHLGYLFREGKSGTVNISMWQRMIDNYDLIEQALSDKQDNIVPIIAVTGKTPQELRSLFGKNPWKRICANSRTRNMLMVKHYLRSKHFGFTENASDIAQHFITLTNVPSGLVTTRRCPTDAVMWVYNQGYKIREITTALKSQSDELYNMIRDYMDTKQVAWQLNMPFNPTWSKRMMKEKHDLYMRIRQEQFEITRRDRDEKYRQRMDRLEGINLSEFYGELVYNDDGVKATILCGVDAYKNESSVMHHCIGVNYLDLALSGKYLGVTIESDEDRSTLGMYVNSNAQGDLIFQVDQHRGVCNATVTSEKNLKMAEIVVQSLNRKQYRKDRLDELTKIED